MSFQITTAFVEQYKANVEMLSQQKGTRMQKAVRVESLTGEFGFFEQIGPTAAQRKTARHMDTPQIDTQHARRRVTMEDYVWADYIDKEDELRMLIDPTSPYAVNAVNAFGRTKDDVIIEALLGVAYAGKRGQIVTALPDSQKIVNGGTGLTIDKLIAAKGKFWAADVDEDDKLWMSVNGIMLENLLKTTQVTSSDYNTVKALVKGDVDSFMGFDFIRSERLPKTGNIRSGIAWAQSGLVMAMGKDTHVRIGERADKNYLTQVWCGQSIGAVRMEEVKVVQVDCDETWNPT